MKLLVLGNNGNEIEMLGPLQWVNLRFEPASFILCFRRRKNNEQRTLTCRSGRMLGLLPAPRLLRMACPRQSGPLAGHVFYYCQVPPPSMTNIRCGWS
jgi:hypothetical protein